MVTVADLKDQIGTQRPRPILYCTLCGAENSAHKGDYFTLCLLGDKIDNNVVKTFMDSPEVKKCLPTDGAMAKGSCQCSPKICIEGAVQPFADRPR